MNPRILKLQKEVKELMDWKNHLESQQVDFPLGVVSQDVIRKNLLMFTGETGVSISADVWLEVITPIGLIWLAAQEI